MAQEKEYAGTIVLGASTPTYDLESAPEHFQPIDHLTDEQIHAATKPLTGEILQVPPIHSAIKKDGVRAYELARQGEVIELKARNVVITEFSITRIELPEVDFKVICSTGTYIRSLANDFGRLLGCGGYLSRLCRTRIGGFSLQDAMTMEQANEFVKSQLDQNG